MNQSTRSTIPANVLGHLVAHQDAMVAMVKEFASIESPSSDPQSQEPMFAALSSTLESIGYRCRHVAGQSSGGALIAFPAKAISDLPNQMLLGHCDTVWPHGTLATMPVHSKNGCLFGPGVFDMKGGLVQAIFALGVLRELGLDPPANPVVVINSDEEIGSVESAELIHVVAKNVDRAFVMEPSLAGKLKTQRKGVLRFTISIKGRSAHAGLDPEKGVSAIVELAHVIEALAQMNDPRRGITVNVGVVTGGVQPNVVAASAEASVDVRVCTAEDARLIDAEIRGLCPTLAGAELMVRGGVSRPPLEATPRNRAIWRMAVDAARELGFEINEATVGGGSDGNFTSQHTATLDGLGAVGDGAHAKNEHLVVAELPRRAALLACLLLADPAGVSDPNRDKQNDLQAFVNGLRL